MKNYNLELKERITEILFRNVLWGEKKKTVNSSRRKGGKMTKSSLISTIILILVTGLALSWGWYKFVIFLLKAYG